MTDDIDCGIIWQDNESLSTHLFFILIAEQYGSKGDGQNMQISTLITAFLVLGLLMNCGCSYKSPIPIDLPESEMDDYARGVRDGERYALRFDSNIWITSGCFFSLLAVGAAWGTTPTPPEHVILGKSQEYVSGYNEAFQNKSRVKNTNYAWIGCFISGGIALAVYRGLQGIL